MKLHLARSALSVIFILYVVVCPSVALRCYNCAQWTTTEQDDDWCIDGTPKSGSGFQQDCSLEEELCGKVVVRSGSTFVGGFKSCISHSVISCFGKKLGGNLSIQERKGGCKTLKTTSISHANYFDIYLHFATCAGYPSLELDATTHKGKSKKLGLTLCTCRHDGDKEESENLCNQSVNILPSKWVIILSVMLFSLVSM